MTTKPSREERFDVNDWLRNTYGLDDDDCLSAGRVEELAESLEHDVRVALLDELLSEVGGMKKERSELPMKGSHYKFGYDQALKDVKAIINNKKQ